MPDYFWYKIKDVENSGPSPSVQCTYTADGDACCVHACGLQCWHCRFVLTTDLFAGRFQNKILK